jgi:hypothetical protein
MDDSTFIFELLLFKDLTFVSNLNNYIKLALTEGIIESKDVPFLVIKLVELLENKKIYIYLEHRLSLAETYKLFTLFSEYIISKIVCEFNSIEFIEVYNNCINLAVSNLKFIKKPRRWLCI